MSDSWAFYFARVNGAVSSILTDLSAREHAPDTSRPHLLWAWLPLQVPREDGLSSSEEFDTLNRIEDALTGAVEKVTKGQYVGRITGAGRREYYFYAPKPDNFGEVVAAICAQFEGYAPEWGDQPDPAWSQYLELLYPSGRELQRIRNTQVVEALKSHGDSLTKVRPVTHWVYFADEAGRQEARARLTAAGFSAEDSDNTASGGRRPLGLRLERTDRVDQDSIDATVFEILDAIENVDADYDGWECPVEA